MCKADDLIERYNLSPPREEYEMLDEYLLARWKGLDGLESEGYQTLTEWFNKRVLARIYEEHGRDTPKYRIDAEYEILTAEQDARYDELAADLATNGIDIDNVQAELLSWSTMRRHLNECLGGEKEPMPPTSDWELESIEVARSKAIEKAQSALQSLSSKQRLPDATKADVDIQVKLSCPQCPTRVSIKDAVDRGYVCKDHFQTVPERPSEEDSSRKVQYAVLPSGMTQILVSLIDDVTYTTQILISLADDIAYTLNGVAALGGL